MNLDEDNAMASGLRRKYPERRKYPRYVTNIPASVEIVAPTGEVPFSVEDALICDISRGGVGLSLTISTATTPDQLSKFFLQRLSCRVYCHFPGNESISTLRGTVAWTAPHRRTEGGTEIRFGVALERTESDDMKALEVFLGAQVSEI